MHLRTIFDNEMKFQQEEALYLNDLVNSGGNINEEIKFLEAQKKNYLITANEDNLNINSRIEAYNKIKNSANIDLLSPDSQSIINGIQKNIQSSLNNLYANRFNLSPGEILQTSL